MHREAGLPFSAATVPDNKQECVGASACACVRACVRSLPGNGPTDLDPTWSTFVLVPRRLSITGLRANGGGVW